jgi:hypothetical protein
VYYYSFTDAHIAQQYLGLSRRQQKRFEPIITGFNPAAKKVRVWEKANPAE